MAKSTSVATAGALGCCTAPTKAGGIIEKEDGAER